MKKFHTFMGNLGKQKCWSQGTILGYLGTPLGTLGYLDALKIFFSPIIYCTLVINSRFYLIKSKGSDFLGLGSQFWPFN